MRAIRCRGSAAALAALLAFAGAADAANYTLSGRFTSNRGKAAQVPLVGASGCGGLTFMSGPGAAGTATPATHPFAVGINERGGMDLGCVPHAPGGVVPGVGKRIATTGRTSVASSRCRRLRSGIPDR